jgi:hypothetical protein
VEAPLLIEQRRLAHRTCSTADQFSIYQLSLKLHLRVYSYRRGCHVMAPDREERGVPTKGDPVLAEIIVL